MKNVIIYTTPYCHYCKMAKDFFNQNNIQYSEKDVAANKDAAEEMIEKSHQMGVPVTVVSDGNGEHIIVGFDEEGFKSALEI